MTDFSKKTTHNKLKAIFLSNNRIDLRKIFILAVVSVIFTALIVLFSGWYIVLKSNTNNDKDVEFVIRKNFTIDSVINSLEKENILKSSKTFKIVTRLKKYDRYVKPGKYIIKPHQNNNELINYLRLGNQTIVKLVFNNIRTIESLAGKMSTQIECDSVSLLKVLNDKEYLAQQNADTINVLANFIPNTYEVYWDIEPKVLVKRMLSEYKLFWNDKRLKKAEKLKLTPKEVCILASIVQEETNKRSEMPTVAGVYVNRLKKRIPLQADPTVKFAIGDFSIKRILTVHLNVDSPFNTYKHYGLPPSVISMPTIQAIDAVLNCENHKYLYFCASPDFDGSHVFAKTLREHNNNANKYRKALNKRRIFK